MTLEAPLNNKRKFQRTAPSGGIQVCLSVFKKQYKFKDFETLKSKRLEVTSQLNGNAVQRL